MTSQDKLQVGGWRLEELERWAAREAQAQEAQEREAPSLSRRGFLGGLAVAAVVVGFDPLRGSWLTEADAAQGAVSVDDFPAFEGQLLTDAASLAAAADDFGHEISRQPLAVLQPGSVDDIRRLMRFARRYDIQVAARGQGHSTYGQAQVEAGVVIDMAPLGEIGEIESGPHGHSVWVGGGTVWLDLLEQTVPAGFAPPTLTDYVELSVGGTLSVGGVGSQSFHEGAQVDNVLELQVVTGRGTLHTCSRRSQRKLFDAVRGGLGQFGVIVAARLRLLPQKPWTRFYEARYPDLSPFMDDLYQLVDDGRFDTVQGFVEPDGAGSWIYKLEASKNYVPGDEPDDAALLAGLTFPPASLIVTDLPLLGYLNRLGPVIDFLKQIGVFFFPHPWIDVFVPGDGAEDYLAQELALLDPDDVGGGPILIYPYRRSAFRAPNLRVPEGDRIVLFGLLRTAVPPTPQRSSELVAQNVDLYERTIAAGGFFYPVDSVPMTPELWRQHFGGRWREFRQAKRRYDPHGLLTPGQNIFP